MTLDWSAYDRFDWVRSRQEPMTAKERQAFEDSLARLLAVSCEGGERTWGTCSPPGRYAATVVQLDRRCRHRFEPMAAELNVREVGVKVYKLTLDAQRQSGRLVRFHRQQLAQLPGIPHTRVQRTIDAGTWTAEDGAASTFVVVEWIPGESLQQCHARWKSTPISRELAVSLVRQLIGEIVIPLWSVGTVWWDFRDANFCFNSESRQLRMIDADSLAAYAEEIIDTPNDWTRRAKGRKTALARLRQMTTRIVLAQGHAPKRSAQELCQRLWRSELEPVLEQLGQPANGGAAQDALQRFLARLHEHQLT